MTEDSAHQPPSDEPSTEEPSTEEPRTEEPSTPLVGNVVESEPSGASGDRATTPLRDLVEQPAKVMRIGGMIRQLLEEVKAAPLDEASRSRLREIHSQSIKELEEGLAPELVEELQRLSLPFDAEAPSESELRIAQAQLVGWLEGLFHGIQAALYAQQVQAQTQIQNMRLALPDGSGQGAGQNGVEGPDSGGNVSTGGMYL